MAGAIVGEERGAAWRGHASAPRTRAALVPALALVLMLAGCGDRGAGPLPEEAGPAAAAPEARPPSLPSEVADEDALRQFYANVQSDLIATGRLRMETAPADAPYDVDDLVRDFERVALYSEYTDVNGEFIHAESPSVLRRWNVPVRVAAMASPSTPKESARDRGNVAAFTQRLARLTSSDIRMADDTSVNFLVLFMNSSERQTFADEIRARYPTFAPAVMNALTETPLDQFCVTYAFADPNDPALYSAVLILIRAEHPQLTRLSCVHEEMAQAMGLPNDSPEARPSLFSDSLEFALLTEHDEILLRMLYDPRLRPGMTAEEARPLLPQIARDAIAAEQRDGGATVLAVN